MPVLTYFDIVRCTSIHGTAERRSGDTCRNSHVYCQHHVILSLMIMQVSLYCVNWFCVDHARYTTIQYGHIYQCIRMTNRMNFHVIIHRSFIHTFTEYTQTLLCFFWPLRRLFGESHDSTIFVLKFLHSHRVCNFAAIVRCLHPAFLNFSCQQLENSTANENSYTKIAHPHSDQTNPKGAIPCNSNEIKKM